MTLCGPDPHDQTFELSAGPFRALEWPGSDDATVLFLHGLSGVADVWTDTMTALSSLLGKARPRCVAMDQRAHGHSPRTPGAYGAHDYLGDAVELIETISKGSPIRLVGHSMGARVAILAASRHPELVESVVIVDIGPEAWQANIDNTSKMFGALPERFADRAEALEFGRLSKRGEKWAQRFVTWRLRDEEDGTFTWLADRDGLIASVTTQRARDYWDDWEAIRVPALLVRGGTSKEVRPEIAAEMRRRNPRVDFVQIDGVGHNIPLLAPERLADELVRFWQPAVDDATGEVPVR